MIRCFAEELCTKYNHRIGHVSTWRAEKILVLIVAGVLALNGCVATSNFYSGRTLEENKFSIGFGADDIVLKSSDKSVTVSKDGPLAPSIIAAYGLPLRLEIGMRYYPVNFVEASLRHQVNPRSFNVIDLSLNLHYALRLGGYSYIKYGVTLSKNIDEFEPYIHYSAYRFVGATTSIFDDSFISGAAETFVNNNRSVGFGIALPVRRAKLYPELNYQYFGGDFSHGLWHFGIGVRVCTN